MSKDVIMPFKGKQKQALIQNKKIQIKLNEKTNTN